MQTQTLNEFATQKQILFDDALVEDKRGFSLTMNPPSRTDAPVITAERSHARGERYPNDE